MATRSQRDAAPTSALRGSPCPDRVLPRSRTSPARVSRERDGYRTRVVEPEVVVVPAGDALLGDPPRTQHVNVFAIARHPVSVGEYGNFLDTAGHTPPANWTAQRGERERAVDAVSWADAVAYCRWLTVGTGRIYRLPDEREWEKAARQRGLLEGLGLLEWT